MLRGKYLTEFEKGKIAAFKEEGKGMTEIAKLIERSKTVVYNYIKLGNKYGIKKSTGRRNIIDKRSERKLLRYVSNKTISIDKIKADFNLTASNSTIIRTINKAPHIINKKKGENHLLRPFTKKPD